jgi:hypothetical protein
VLEHTFCLFETGVGEIDLVASAAAFDLIMIISHMPECVARAKLVVFRHDIVIVHTTIIAISQRKNNRKNSCKINNLWHALSPSERAREGTYSGG